jgi:nucleobase:cation symporter-1, NCS1 family
VESRSIDFIPLSERYGTPKRLFTLWSSSNLTVLAVALGTLGAASGLSLGATIVALVLGNAVGTAFTAAHSAQGPLLGVPQMIQSRAQFGVLGAAIPLLAVVAMYLLYCAANGILVASSLTHILPVGTNAALLIFGLVTLAVAYAGYEFIHRAAVVLTVISTLVFGVATWLLLSTHATTIPPLSAGRFTAASFILVATQAAAWALTYAPYVADYSRYLPPTVSSVRTFWHTAAGCFLGSTFVMVFGAVLAASDPALAGDPAAAVVGLFGPAAPVVRVLVLVAVIQANVMNLYSAYLSTITIFSGLRHMRRVGSAAKLLTMGILIFIATMISLFSQDDFNAYFADALCIMVYLLIPWSAINLADFYLVRHGHYVIEDLYRVDGTYGAWRWPALGVFAAGILVQAPFFHLTFYKGSVAQWLGADIAWIPGLLVSAVLYVMASRSTVRNLAVSA